MGISINLSRASLSNLDRIRENNFDNLGRTTPKSSSSVVLTSVLVVTECNALASNCI